MVRPMTLQTETINGVIDAMPRVHAVRVPFVVPAGTARLQVSLRFEQRPGCQLFLAVFDEAGFRGSAMRPGVPGAVALEVWLTAGAASPGALPGAIVAGEWCALIDVERLAVATAWELVIAYAPGATEPAAEAPPPSLPVGASEPGWYVGELHAHSHHSDGAPTVPALLRAARRANLDFLALTDHFTISGHAEAARQPEPGLTVIRSLELTGHHGHANLHGVPHWVDCYVDDRAEWTINDAARAVRAAGGLFCVNHPFAADLGWRYLDFDWDLADLLEVWHAREGPGNTLAFGLWDEQLRAGRRITGVAATDSHDLRVPRHRLGGVRTQVYAAANDEAALLAGLRGGRVAGSRGPLVDALAWRVNAPARQWSIGATVPAGALGLRFVSTPTAVPWQLHLLKRGAPWRVFDGPAGIPVSVEVVDEATAGSYYRWELHAASPLGEYPEDRWREWHTLLAFTNPIFVATAEELA
jgi:hypothetical protein